MAPAPSTRQPARSCSSMIACSILGFQNRSQIDVFESRDLKAHALILFVLSSGASIRFFALQIGLLQCGNKKCRRILMLCVRGARVDQFTVDAQGGALLM